jgi:hypothetical protein
MRTCAEVRTTIDSRAGPRSVETRRAWASFVRTTEVTRHGTAAWTWLHSPKEEQLSNSGGTGCTSCCQVLAGRNALFVSRFDGAFLLLCRADVRRLIVERPPEADEGLAAARWKVIANQAPLLPDDGKIRGRISATAIWPTSTPSIKTGTDCPGLNMMHEE